jgi:hypothetical protein
MYIVLTLRNGAKTISLPNVVGRLNKGSNTGKRARRENLRHPRERFLVSNETPPSWRPIEIFLNIYHCRHS